MKWERKRLDEQLSELRAKHRERWACGGSIIQYCGVRGSNRTFNGLLKIKVTNPACVAYEEDAK